MTISRTFLCRVYKFECIVMSKYKAVFWIKVWMEFEFHLDGIQVLALQVRDALFSMEQEVIHEEGTLIIKL